MSAQYPRYFALIAVSYASEYRGRAGSHRGSADSASLRAHGVSALAPVSQCAERRKLYVPEPAWR